MASPRNSPKRGGARPEQQQVRRVNNALHARDFAAMQRLAFQPSGFCSSELRRVVWQFLLGVMPSEATDANWKRLLLGVNHEGKDARTIHMDVQRSVYSWDVHTKIRKTARNQKRIHLSEVMHGILCRHSGKLAYFQGFHDIALVFLEVGTPSQAFHMVERLALFYLTDQLCLPFDQGLTPLLGVLFFLLQLLDPPLAEALDEAGCGELHFAVPWVLTWFAHSLPRLHQQVMRLFDCLIAGHPAMILYFSAALLLQHRDLLLQTTRDLPDMVCVIQGLPLEFLDVDDWAAQAWALAKRVPPERLLERLPPERRRRLPATSPLLHYPYPWLPRGSGALVALPIEDLQKVAPIYNKGLALGGAGARAATGPLSILPHASSILKWRLKALSLAGVVALVAWAFAGRAWARG